MTQHYKIKPLEFEQGFDSEGCKEYKATTPFGDYYIQWWQDIGWAWGTDRSRMYNCSSLEEAKTLANKHWQERLIGALVEVG